MGGGDGLPCKKGIRCAGYSVNSTVPAIKRNSLRECYF